MDINDSTDTNPLEDKGNSQKLPARRARDFGLDRAQHFNGCPDSYSPRDIANLVDWLVEEKGFRIDYLMSVRPRPISVAGLERKLKELLQGLQTHWSYSGKWFNYCGIVSPSEASHGSHAHVLFTGKLTPAEQRIFTAVAAEVGIDAKFTGNTRKWLDQAKNASEHKNKAKYALDHLKIPGSSYFIGDEFPNIPLERLVGVEARFSIDGNSEISTTVDVELRGPRLVRLRFSSVEGATAIRSTAGPVEITVTDPSRDVEYELVTLEGSARGSAHGKAHCVARAKAV